MWTFKDKEKSV